MRVKHKGNEMLGHCLYIFSLPGQSPGRAIVLPPASALAKCYVFYFEVFYVMGKVLSGELSCPCDRSCWNMNLYTLKIMISYHTFTHTNTLI